MMVCVGKLDNGNFIFTVYEDGASWSEDDAFVVKSCSEVMAFVAGMKFALGNVRYLMFCEADVNKILSLKPGDDAVHITI